MDISEERFHGCRQLSLSYDPSTYCGQDTAVAVGYNIPGRISTYCAIKVVPKGKHLVPHQVPMEQSVAETVAQKKFERWAGYKEIRALSSMVHDLTGFPLDDYKLGSSFVVRRLQNRETRVVSPNQIATIILEDQFGNVVQTTPAMPRDFDVNDLFLITVYIDQGAIGMAALNYVMGYLQLMLIARYDAFHRGIRDIIAATTKTARALFRRVNLMYAFICSLNYGPFGKGANFEEKKEMLEYFHSVADHTHESFRRYVKLHAALNSLRCETVDDFKNLFETFMDMNSFNFKGPVPKISRWYAWWDGFQFHHPELWGFKCILEVYLDVDPRCEFDLSAVAPQRTAEAELRALKGQSGGSCWRTNL